MDIFCTCEHLIRDLCRKKELIGENGRCQFRNDLGLLFAMLWGGVRREPDKRSKREKS